MSELKSVKVGPNGEIIIKEELRKKFGIKPGQEIIEFDAGDHIVIIPISSEPLKSLAGKYNWEETTEQLKKMAEDLALAEINKS